ncbi:MAG: hypothetical protein U9N62_11475, partial [Thermotogota bacterium]|nr:hypothetical protein [Thermotogota bacterium]
MEQVGKSRSVAFMKILHTSDWHIGRSLYGRKRYDEFSVIAGKYDSPSFLGVAGGKRFKDVGFSDDKDRINLA